MAVVSTLVVLVVASCSVDVDDLHAETLGFGSASASAVTTGLPPLGPVPGSTHWHAAYVVRVCGDVLAPFAEAASPVGIHTHGDALIHIHPSVESSGFEQATLGHFIESVGMRLADDELALPGGGVWRNGDFCDDGPGEIFVDRWSGPGPDGEVTRLFGGFDEIRFTADGEVYQIAFAPRDSLPVVPPSWPDLFEVSPSLGQPQPAPWIRVDPDASPDEVRFATVDGVTAAPCNDTEYPEAVLDGPVTCFSLGDIVLDRSEAFEGALAVEFNRQPAVALTITPGLRATILDAFEQPEIAEAGLALAIVVGDEVVTAPMLRFPSASERRLILSGGLSVESARDLAALLNG